MKKTLLWVATGLVVAGLVIFGYLQTCGGSEHCNCATDSTFVDTLLVDSTVVDSTLVLSVDSVK